MTSDFVLFWILQLLVFLIGVSVGHSVLLLKIRKESNKSKALDFALLQKRKEVLVEGKKVANDLEEVLYKAKIQDEINKLTEKDELKP